jgi:hypothetical protein
MMAMHDASFINEFSDPCLKLADWDGYFPNNRLDARICQKDINKVESIQSTNKLVDVGKMSLKSIHDYGYESDSEFSETGHLTDFEEESDFEPHLPEFLMKMAEVLDDKEGRSRSDSTWLECEDPRSDDLNMKIEFTENPRTRCEDLVCGKNPRIRCEDLMCGMGQEVPMCLTECAVTSHENSDEYSDVDNWHDSSNTGHRLNGNDLLEPGCVSSASISEYESDYYTEYDTDYNTVYETDDYSENESEFDLEENLEENSVQNNEKVGAHCFPEVEDFQENLKQNIKFDDFLMCKYIEDNLTSDNDEGLLETEIFLNYTTDYIKYQNVLAGVFDNEDKNLKGWSILTDHLNYVADNHKCTVSYKQVKPKLKDAKELYFNAAHNNVPQNNQEVQSLFDSKSAYFDAANNNIPLNIFK